MVVPGIVTVPVALGTRHPSGAHRYPGRQQPPPDPSGHLPYLQSKLGYQHVFID